MYKVRNVQTGQYLNRFEKDVFSNEGDFFKTFTIARNQRDRALLLISQDLEIIQFSFTEIGVVG